MKKVILGIFLIASAVAGIAFASSVTTNDGINYQVTDDAGYVVNYTNLQIQQKIGIYGNQYVQYQQMAQAADEAQVIFNGISQMASNAYANWQDLQNINQVNGS